MRLVLAAASVLALVACGPAEQPAPPAEPAPPVEPAPPATPELNGVDLTKDLRAVGTEPFWAVEITAPELKFSGADLPERTARNNGPVVEGAQAVWTAAADDGSMLSVTLTPGPCSDGMSDRTYPLTARVQLGPQTYNGCAATVEALERMRGQESGEVR